MLVSVSSAIANMCFVGIFSAMGQMAKPAKDLSHRNAQQRFAISLYFPNNLKYYDNMILILNWQQANLWNDWKSKAFELYAGIGFGFVFVSRFFFRFHDPFNLAKKRASEGRRKGFLCRDRRSLSSRARSPSFSGVSRECFCTQLSGRMRRKNSAIRFHGRINLNEISRPFAHPPGMNCVINKLIKSEPKREELKQSAHKSHFSSETATMRSAILFNEFELFVQIRNAHKLLRFNDTNLHCSLEPGTWT